MTLKSGIEIPVERVSELCRRYNVAELAVFGPAARGDMSADSDVDVGLFRFAELSGELVSLFGHKVDLVTKQGLKPWVAKNVTREAELVFAA